jgi:hypothetical protein
MKLFKLLFMVLLFSTTANASVNNYEPAFYTSKEIKTPQEIKKLAIESAQRWDVDPAFFIAVMHIESRKGNQEFRVGKMGKTYYGPCGIHKAFLSKWDIDDPKINIEVGARALRGVGYNEQLQIKRLKRYNASFNIAYWKAIKSAKQKYSNEIKNIPCINKKPVLK